MAAAVRWLGSSIHSCATPFQSRRAPVRVVLSGRWPVPLVGSRLESRSAALAGFSATTTSKQPFLALCSCERFAVVVGGVFLCRCVLCACACDLLRVLHTHQKAQVVRSPPPTRSHEREPHAIKGYEAHAAFVLALIVDTHTRQRQAASFATNNTRHHVRANTRAMQEWGRSPPSLLPPPPRYPPPPRRMPVKYITSRHA